MGDMYSCGSGNAYERGLVSCTLAALLGGRGISGSGKTMRGLEVSGEEGLKVEWRWSSFQRLRGSPEGDRSSFQSSTCRGEGCEGGAAPVGIAMCG